MKNNTKLIHYTTKALGVVILLSAFIFLPGLLQRGILPFASSNPSSRIKDSIAYNEHEILLKKELMGLDKKLNAFVPKSHYLIINSSENTFVLYKGKELVLEGKCSTGSYLQLEKGENQKWLFKTPKGIFPIRNKRTNPVWKKPDWAFVEEGLPVPSANHDSRFEYGVLGDYALSLGDGYLIHGTLYQRYLGLPVTHGCVRLNDADLEKVYRSLEIGSKVYIY